MPRAASDDSLYSISEVAVVPSLSKKPEKPLLIIAPDIASEWNRQAAEVQVYANTTLADVTTEEALNEYRLRWVNVACATPSDIFLPELTFVVCSTNVISGGLNPESTQAMMFADEPITPLIPFHSLLLKYFTAEELNKRIHYRPLPSDRSSEHPQIEVTIELPLAGKNSSQRPQPCLLTRVYPLLQKNALDIIPVLELWPYFQADDWKTYYGFFFDSGAGKLTFQVKFHEEVEKEHFKDNQGGHYSITRMDKCPSCIECTNANGNLIGLVLLSPPPRISPRHRWKVGIEFNAQTTNAQTEHSGRVDPVYIQNDELLLHIVDSPLDTRFTTLYSYFLPECFLPTEKPLPHRSLLTTLGSSLKVIGDRAIIDGRIYNPSAMENELDAGWLVNGVDWSNFPATRLFLKNLILLISASALKQGANSLKWMISYPSNFSRNQRRLCAKTWHDLTEEMAELTGIEHQCPSTPNSTQFVPTALAMGRYFYHHERRSLDYAVCIYMQEDVTEIGVWQRDHLIHHCSINFAGKHLLADFLALNRGFVSRYFSRDLNEWAGLQGKSFYKKLNTLLRWENEEWLRQKLPILADTEEVRALMCLMLLGFSGLYYYIGLILKTLGANGLLQQSQTPPVYIGGSHAYLLDWLTPIGKFSEAADTNELLSCVLAQAAGLVTAEERTHLSQQPKDEIAIGLVSGGRQLSGMNPKEPVLLVPGEAFEINQMAYAWDYSVVPDERVTQFEISTTDKLSNFLYAFYQAAEQLRMENAKEPTGYTHSENIKDNRALWIGLQPLIMQLIAESGFVVDVRKMRSHPPFILTLKALLIYTSQQWIKKYTR